MDDRGGAWPGDEARLAQIEDELAALQDEITRLRGTLPGLLKSDPRGIWETLSSPDSADEPSGARGRGTGGLRFPSDAIGGVEKQLTALRWEVDRLLRLVGVRPAGRAGGPPGARPRRSVPAGRPRGDTVPAETGGALPAGDQPDGGAGDDDLNRSLYPTEGPGGSGPEKVEPEEPKPGFGF